MYFVKKTNYCYYFKWNFFIFIIDHSIFCTIHTIVHIIIIDAISAVNWEIQFFFCNHAISFDLSSPSPVKKFIFIKQLTIQLLFYGFTWKNKQTRPQGRGFLLLKALLFKNVCTHIYICIHISLERYITCYLIFVNTKSFINNVLF